MAEAAPVEPAAERDFLEVETAPEEPPMEPDPLDSEDHELQNARFDALFPSTAQMAQGTANYYLDETAQGHFMLNMVYVLQCEENHPSMLALIDYAKGDNMPMYQVLLHFPRKTGCVAVATFPAIPLLVGTDGKCRMRGTIICAGTRVDVIHCYPYISTRYVSIFKLQHALADASTSDLPRKLELTWDAHFLTADELHIMPAAFTQWIFVVSWPRLSQ